MKPSAESVRLTEEIAARLNAKGSHVSGAAIRAIINHESGWNPKIKNPKSTARGLIQFIDSTAKGLGYAGSLDLVTKHPTAESQLAQGGPVERYFRAWAPIKDDADLMACVFKPAWRKKLDAPLSAEEKAVNPGINTIREYIARVYKLAGFTYSPAAAGGGVLLLLIIGGWYAWRSRMFA